VSSQVERTLVRSPPGCGARGIFRAYSETLLLPVIRTLVPASVEIIAQGGLIADRLADWMGRHIEMEPQVWCQSPSESTFLGERQDGLTICEPYGNNCGNACLSGCTSTSCGVQNRCNASFRCEAIPCSEGYPCAVDDVCALSGKTDATHGCRAQACTSGYVCPSGKHCAVGAMGADSHGCEADPCSQTGCPMNHECLPGGWPTGGCQLRKCASDADCDCGYCVLGTCAERLNICSVRFY
jgi:hypothetical protein